MKTVLITGASSGIGKAAARRFAQEGWNVVTTMRSPAVETELGQLPNVLVARLDVQDLDSIEQAVSQAVARFGTIDVLVNNAGFGLYGLFEATSREKILEEFQVNVFGLMDVTRAVLPLLHKQHGGVVINVGSGGGAFGLPMMSLYCATKFALEGFSESLSYELASQNIAVKLIEPGRVTRTNYDARSGLEASRTPLLTEYQAFVEQTSAAYEAMKQERAGTTSEGVADVIYQAATDGTDRLRYVASDDITYILKLRRETSEDEYMRQMRARFLPRRTEPGVDPPSE